MTIHRYKSGLLKLVASWGHGRNTLSEKDRKELYQRSDVLIHDDHDGHYTAWTWSGEKVDAAKKLAEVYSKPWDELLVAVLIGNFVRYLRRKELPHGFVEEINDENGDLIQELYHPETLEEFLIII